MSAASTRTDDCGAREMRSKARADIEERFKHAMDNKLESTVNAQECASLAGPLFDADVFTRLQDSKGYHLMFVEVSR